MRVRHGEAVAHAGIADAAADDDAVDMVAVALRIGQRLQHQRAHTLAKDGAVGAQPIAPDLLRRLAGEMLLRGGDQLLRVQKQADAAGQRHLAAPGAQHVDGLVHAGRGGRTHGVEEIGRAGEAIEIGHHVRHGAGIAAAGQRAPHQHVLEAVEVVLIGHRADQHRDIAAIACLHIFARIAGILEGLDAGLQEQPHLRRHQLRLMLRDAEIARVELVDILQEGAGLHHRLAEHVALRVQQCGMIPALGGIGLEPVQPVRQHLPEFVLAGGAGDAQRQADDGDVVPVVLISIIRARRDGNRCRRFGG